MAKPNARNAFGTHAHHTAEADYRQPPCTWRGCIHPRWNDTPVCIAHALAIVGRVQDDVALHACEEYPAPAPRQGFVYYLMIGPSTVKIGTTTYLDQRMIQLRTDMQYVVAVELGGRDVERQRHLQFTDERHGRREDFHLSDRLKQHIETLAPQRDEMIRLAATHPDRSIA